MNWSYLRHCAWLDTRARFVAGVPHGGTLLDLGSSDGETLRHIGELRPDLRLLAVDLAGSPERYPPACQFQRADLEKDQLPWPDASLDAITCMHLVEHLRDHTRLRNEVARLLKPAARVYFETPHPRSLTLPSPRGAAAGTFTLNFWDDPTHVQPVAIGALAQELRGQGFRIEASGISRNWIFAAAYLLFWFLPASRKKFTARIHWLGWSAYLIAQRQG
jgi:SAM-dependent methyltransferase